MKVFNGLLEPLEIAKMIYLICKYLGVLEAGGFQCEEVKSRVQEIYKQ